MPKIKVCFNATKELAELIDKKYKFILNYPFESSYNNIKTKSAFIERVFLNELERIK